MGESWLRIFRHELLPTKEVHKPGALAFTTGPHACLVELVWFVHNPPQPLPSIASFWHISPRDRIALVYHHTMNPFSAEHGHYPTTLFSQSRSVVFNASIGRMDRDKQQTANREFPDPCLPYAKTATQRKHNATLCLCLYVTSSSLFRHNRLAFRTLIFV